MIDLLWSGTSSATANLTAWKGLTAQAESKYPLSAVKELLHWRSAFICLKVKLPGHVLLFRLRL